MTEVGTSYGNALYTLAKDEGLAASIQKELTSLCRGFEAEPGFCALLSNPALTKDERCRILDDSFRGKVHPYVLNFMKILTEQGYMRHFSDCCQVYTGAFYDDEGILPVTAVTAVAMTEAQAETLRRKLGQITGKRILLDNKIDTAVLGGVRLDYEGKRLDDTVSHRLDAIRELLTKTV